MVLITPTKEEQAFRNEMELEIIRQSNELMKSFYGNKQRLDLYMH
tara:strand:- start:334 stop:468 length:135 start_codon:yes stop_codon:yes gene_type:complete